MCGRQLPDNYVSCPNCGNTSLTINQTNQQNVNNNMQSGYQQPMINVQSGISVQGNMSMTYATVYMVLLGIGMLGYIISFFNNFSVSNLAEIAYLGITIYFLYKRAKIGRILAIVLNIFSIVLGAFVLLFSILVKIGVEYIKLPEDYSYIYKLGNWLSIILLVLGIIYLIFGICSTIYFKKRACMYLN